MSLGLWLLMTEQHERLNGGGEDHWDAGHHLVKGIVPAWVLRAAMLG